MSEKQALLAGWAGRVSALRGWRRRGLAFLLGTLAGLAFPPLYAFPLLVVGLTGLMWMIDGRRPGLASFSAGWWWGFGHFLVCFYWVSEALLVDPVRFGWMIPFIMGGLAGATALFIGLAALATRWLDYPGAAKAIALAASWTGAEWLRGHILSGFPWDLRLQRRLLGRAQPVCGVGRHLGSQPSRRRVCRHAGHPGYGRTPGRRDQCRRRRACSTCGLCRRRHAPGGRRRGDGARHDPAPGAAGDR